MNEHKLNTVFDELSPSDEQVNRIYDTMKRRQSTPLKAVKKPKALPLLVAIIVLLITAVAAVTGLSQGSLQFLSQFSSKEQEYWESGAFVVNQSVSNDAGTITVKEVLGDDATTLIFLDFIAPEGQVLNKEMYDFYWRDVSVKYSGLTYGFDPIEDPDPTDNVVPFVFSITTEGSLAGDRIQLTFRDCIGSDSHDDMGAYRDLQYNQQRQDVDTGETSSIIVGDGGTTITIPQSASDLRELPMTEEEILAGVTVFEGVWELDFDADFKTFATTYKPKMDIVYEGTEIRWDRVSVSPISMQVWASFDVADRDAVDSLADQLRTFTVHYQDGTVTEVDGASGSIDFITGDIQSTLDYTQLDLDQPIVAVTYLGETYDFGT